MNGKFCTGCGAAATQAAHFCGQCGSPLEAHDLTAVQTGAQNSDASLIGDTLLRNAMDEAKWLRVKGAMKAREWKGRRITPLLFQPIPQLILNTPFQQAVYIAAQAMEHYEEIKPTDLLDRLQPCYATLTLTDEDNAWDMKDWVLVAFGPHGNVRSTLAYANTELADFGWWHYARFDFDYAQSFWGSKSLRIALVRPPLREVRYEFGAMR